jgi:hypothetical protein
MHSPTPQTSQEQTLTAYLWFSENTLYLFYLAPDSPLFKVIYLQMGQLGQCSTLCSLLYPIPFTACLALQVQGHEQVVP